MPKITKPYLPAMWVPTCPYNLMPPQLLVRYLKPAGFEVEWFKHDDKTYVFEYRRPGEEHFKKLYVPLGTNDVSAPGPASGTSPDALPVAASNGSHSQQTTSLMTTTMVAALTTHRRLANNSKLRKNRGRVLTKCPTRSKISPPSVTNQSRSLSKAKTLLWTMIPLSWPRSAIKVG